MSVRELATHEALGAASQSQIFCCSDTTFAKIAYIVPGILSFLSAAVSISAPFIAGVAAGSPVGFIVAGVAFFAVSVCCFIQASEIYDYSDPEVLKELRGEMERIGDRDHRGMDRFISLHGEGLRSVIEGCQNLRDRLETHQRHFEQGQAQRRLINQNQNLSTWQWWLAHQEAAGTYPQVSVSEILQDPEEL